MVVAVSGATERSGSAGQRITGAVIRAYRLLISPWLGARCRFEPSCSRFTEEAVQRYGVIKGVALGVRRLGSCHPFHPGGFDPVP